MKTLRFTLKPQTSFGTPLLGETLFGELCWAIVRLQGTDRLVELLEGYTDGRPFAVISDAFPEGYVPLPALPGYVWEDAPLSERKILKKKRWIAVSDLRGERAVLRRLAKSDAEIVPGKGTLTQGGLTSHNTINRQTGTTGVGVFAPYQKHDLWMNAAIAFNIYAVVDETRISKEELFEAFRYIGLSGHGRDASAGLGKFSLGESVETLADPEPAKNVLTLASSALSGMTGVDAHETFYRMKTHFGRHGAELAVGGMPFKYPVVLAAAGAWVAFDEAAPRFFIGRGLSGVSPAHPETVHQGYSPVLSLSALEDHS